MKRLALIAAVAATLAAPAAFAQGSVTSSTGASVSSGTGVIVTPSLPASVTVAPAADLTVSGPHLLPGATLVQSSSTTTMGSGPVATTTVVTNYWANVPAGFERRGDVQRWMSLK
jgi:hypothetical protein